MRAINSCPRMENTGIVIPKPSNSATQQTTIELGKMTNDVSKKKGRSSGDKKGKRKVKRRETYAMYIYKVLKQVSEEQTINSVFLSVK